MPFHARPPSRDGSGLGLSRMIHVAHCGLRCLGVLKGLVIIPCLVGVRFARGAEPHLRRRRNLMIRGTLAFLSVSLWLLVGDVIQRTIVVGLVTLLKGKKARILAVWQRVVARVLLWFVRVLGGAHYQKPPRLPGEEGVLVVMNHQSLLDIPMVCSAFDGGPPRIVTRARYAKGKPLISGMLRLYQYPLVGSGATIQEDLAILRRMAEKSTWPLVIYPEGHRTKDGNIRPFKRAGLRALLEGRRWRIHLVVMDGFWRCSKLKDFILTVKDVRGTIRVDGPIESPEPDTDLDEFIDGLRTRMVSMLEEQRQGAEVA